MRLYMMCAAGAHSARMQRATMRGASLGAKLCFGFGLQIWCQVSYCWNLFAWALRVHILLAGNARQCAAQAWAQNSASDLDYKSGFTFLLLERVRMGIADAHGACKQRATMRGARLGAKLGFTFEAQNWFQFSWCQIGFAGARSE